LGALGNLNINIESDIPIQIFPSIKKPKIDIPHPEKEEPKINFPTP
jgi:hypothetical protein